MMAEKQKDVEQLDENEKNKKEDEAHSSSTEGEVLSKRLRRHSPSPGVSPAASPGRHATFEELLQTADLVSNMSLIHEIAVDKDFKLSPRELPEKSIEKQVRDVMHKAFWDSLQDDLQEDPPIYTRAISLLAEVRETLEMLLLPQHTKLREHLHETLDLQLIKQQAEHGVLDVLHYAHYILSVMTKLCAPIRDVEIEKIKSLTDVIELFREIFRVLELMKVDMANFTIQTLRPQIQQQSIEYERNKFSEFLKTQQDGLEITKAWLAQVSTEQFKDQPDSTASAAESASTRVSPMKIINGAYMKIFDWNDKDIFPETLVMDQGRFLDLRDQLRRLTLVASILLVTYTNVGVAISQIKGFPSKLKKEIKILLDGTSDVETTMLNIGEHVCKQVNECLKEHDYQVLEDRNQEALKRQIKAVADQSHSVQKLIDSRAKGFILKMLSARGKFEPADNIPQGLKTVEKETIEISTQFLKLIVHNRQVYGPFYSDIITEMMEEDAV